MSDEATLNLDIQPEWLQRELRSVDTTFRHLGSYRGVYVVTEGDLQDPRVLELIDGMDDDERAQLLMVGATEEGLHLWVSEDGGRVHRSWTPGPPPCAN